MFLHQCSSCSHYENQCKGGRPRKSLVGAAKRKVPAVSSFSTDAEYSTSTDLHPVLTSTPVKNIFEKHVEIQTSPIKALKTPSPRKSESVDMQTSICFPSTSNVTGTETSSCSPPTQSLVDAQTVTTPVAEKQKPVRNADEITAPLTK